MHNEVTSIERKLSIRKCIAFVATVTFMISIAAMMWIIGAEFFSIICIAIAFTYSLFMDICS